MRQVLRRGIALAAASLLLALPMAHAVVAVVAPVATADAYVTGVNIQLSVAAPGVMANDNPTVDTCVAGTDSSVLSGNLSMAMDGSFVYTPQADFRGKTTFTYWVAEGVCSAASSNPATVTITVDDAPIAGADSFIVLKDRTLVVDAPGVLSNDEDANVGDALSAVKVTGPTHGLLVLASDGSFSYTPTSGFVGLDAFSYQASDGLLFSPTRVVSMHVTAPPPSPTPKPTASPTPEPTDTPEPTLEPTASPVVSPSIEPSATAGASPTPSATPAPTPAPSPRPVPAAGEGGVSLPVLLVILLFVLLLGFGAALYVPKWLAAQRGEPLDDDDPR